MPNFIKKSDSELYILSSSLIDRKIEINVFIYKSGLTSFCNFNSLNGISSVPFFIWSIAWPCSVHQKMVLGPQTLLTLLPSVQKLNAKRYLLHLVSLPRATHIGSLCFCLDSLWFSLISTSRTYSYRHLFENSNLTHQTRARRGRK